MKQKVRLATRLLTGFLLSSLTTAFAQVDPIGRNLVELGYDHPISGQGPQAIYAYYYYNNPDFIGTNVALRLAIAPAYLDGELGFKQLISRYTDVGIGLYGAVWP